MRPEQISSSAQDLSGAPRKNLLSLKNVSFSYTTKKGSVAALQGVDLGLEKGEFLCVLGPSGCGKSTLLRLIAGLLLPSSGEIRMNGQPVRGPDWNRGVIFQTPTLYAWLNIRDNIAFGPKMRKLPKKEVLTLSEQYIEMVGLRGFEESRPYELSGGMKQRAALARALVNRPEILLMDEPFGALDALTRQKMQTLVRTIWEQTGNTFFLITHDVDEALSLATKIVVLSDRPGTILNEFRPDFTKHFLGGESESVPYLPEYIDLRKQILEIIRNGSGQPANAVPQASALEERR